MIKSKLKALHYRISSSVVLVTNGTGICAVRPSKTLLGDVISRFNSDTFIDNVCLSYRHDFGLIAEQDRQRLRFECKEWMRAISNNWEYFKKATTMKSEAT